MTAIYFRRFVASAALLLGSTACGMLDVSDPTVIEEEDVANPTGAGLLRNDALRRFYDAFDDHAVWTGMLADEFTMNVAENSFDRRAPISNMAQLVFLPAAMSSHGALFENRGGIYGMWQHTRSAATLAASAGSQTSSEMKAELLVVRGYATLALAEGFCPGFPLNEIVNFTAVYSGPHTTEMAFARALQDFDTASAIARDAADVLRFASVGRGRALLGLGRFAEAAGAVAQVPTGYIRNAEYDPSAFLTEVSSQANNLAGTSSSYVRTVGEREGINGLNFVSAADPRAPVTLTFLSPTFGPRVAMTKYMNKPGEPIVIASGIETRLIEAEAALNSGNASWLSILNGLRASHVSPAMLPLADPGDDDARVDLLFRERAMWLFGTGHRLGDLRRLITHYGRNSESVFPTGAYAAGGTYGTATSLFFDPQVESPRNPAITGCTDR